MYGQWHACMANGMQHAICQVGVQCLQTFDHGCVTDCLAAHCQLGATMHGGPGSILAWDGVHRLSQWGVCSSLVVVPRCMALDVPACCCFGCASPYHTYQSMHGLEAHNYVIM
jgi:hypothetical protein